MLFVFALAAPLCAQTPPTTPTPPAASDSKESFVLEPTGLASGAKDAYLRLVSNTPAGFASSSSRQPEIKFSEGVTLVTGSFKLLNGNEAECKVNIDADSMGVAEVSLVFYSVNGTSVFSTQRATLGLLGPTKLGTVNVSVESVPLVRVNVTTAQAAGVLVLSGPINGAISVTAPTGARFSKIPAATTTKGTINTPALAENNTLFTFSVGNAAREDAVVRITYINYDTSLFTLTGGALGALSCEIGGAALGGQSTLVANAHTALATIAGSNDNTDAPLPGSGTEGSNSTETGNTETPTSGSNVNNPAPIGRSIDDTRNNANRERNNQGNNRRNTPAPSTSQPGPQAGAPRQINPPPPRSVQPANPPPPVPSRQNPPSPVPVSPTKSAPGVSDGKASFARDVPEDGSEPAKSDAPAPVLVTSPGLHFCDKDFKPLDMLVLNSLISDKAGARVWIVVKLKADKTAEIDTIDVTLRVCGVSRTLKLTETGKTTGEFRCDKAGVLLVSTENPDSNVTEEKKTEPKARPSGWGK